MIIFVANPVQVEPNQKISFDDTSIAFSSKNDAALKGNTVFFRLMNNGNLVCIGTWLQTGTGMHLPVRGLIRKRSTSSSVAEKPSGRREKYWKPCHSGVHAILDYGVE